MASASSRQIRVRGLVQGVGFRPTVWRLAHQFGLKGNVLNDGEGVLIHVWGSDDSMDAFTAALTSEQPPLCRIDSVESKDWPDAAVPEDFKILPSVTGEISTSIIADAATCAACLAEINAPENRRYRYPFTNCTHCGPRLSITRAMPYDRANTSMARFVMCARCQDEYDDPADRRFHAQPNACADCGPKIWMCDADGVRLELRENEDVIACAARLLREGHIVAIKGIGGFHLACDAANDDAVGRLRQRKKRYGKPFALMAKNMEMIADFAALNAVSTEALTSAAAPIVVVPKKNGGRALSQHIALGQNKLGLMLPYTPLHHLLMDAFGGVLVMTSGNVSNEPQVTDNDEALRKLEGIADVWLMHDRDIINRLDDSVVQEIAAQASYLRRARGLAPAPLCLPAGFECGPDILAMGGDLKSTFCLVKNGSAVVSQHIGDLQDPAVHADFRKALALYSKAYDFSAQKIAADMHPGYFSSRLGAEFAEHTPSPPDLVQHHHAHIAACLAEHEYPLDGAPVLGIALDGFGYGDDGTLWGGEFLIADYRSYERVTHFEPVAVPGGDKASVEPWRNTYAHLDAAIGWDAVLEDYGGLDIVSYLEEKPIRQLSKMVTKNINAPRASSAGRLFDAVAGALDLHRDVQAFEGQAAMALQALAESCPNESRVYPVTLGKIISWEPMWRSILSDLQRCEEKAIIAARFHNTLVHAITEVAHKIAREKNIRTIVINGGVFQNSLLATGVIDRFRAINLTVLFSQKYPANDGGLSLGQAVISCARSCGEPQSHD